MFNVLTPLANPSYSGTPPADSSCASFFQVPLAVRCDLNALIVASHFAYQSNPFASSLETFARSEVADQLKPSLHAVLASNQSTTTHAQKCP